jgi:hypothetical protein
MKVLFRQLIIISAFLILWFIDFDDILTIHFVDLLAKKLR